MNAVLIRILGGLGIVAALAGGLRAQDDAQPRQTFHSSADLVTIQASVRDGRGRALSGLTAADFEVWDNGQLRPILSLRADHQSPVSVAILVDMSGSMANPTKMGMARQTFDSLLTELRSGDEAALFTFDARLHERHPFTADIEQLRGGLSDFQPFGATSLYDATAETARRLAARPLTHKAIIVLTDGIDTSSSLTASEVSGLASSIAVPVFIVATVPSIDQHQMLEAATRADLSSTADLRDLAHWTGGQLTFASTFLETVLVGSNLIGELRRQYVLAIEAATVSEWRRLDVRVKRPAAVVKARSGYFGG